MLAFHPLVSRPLAQSKVFYLLIVDAGPFTADGQAITEGVLERVDAGTFTLAGQAITKPCATCRSKQVSRMTWCGRQNLEE